MALATFSRFSRAMTSRPSRRRMAWALCSAASSSVHFLSDTEAQQGKRKIHSYTSTFFIWFHEFIKTHRELWIHPQSTSCWEQTRVLRCNCKALKHFFCKLKKIYIYVCLSSEIINIHTWQLCSPFVGIGIFKLKIWGLRQPLFTTHETTHQTEGL